MKNLWSFRNKEKNPLSNWWIIRPKSWWLSRGTFRHSRQTPTFPDSFEYKWCTWLTGSEKLILSSRLCTHSWPRRLRHPWTPTFRVWSNAYCRTRYSFWCKHKCFPLKLRNLLANQLLTNSRLHGCLTICFLIRSMSLPFKYCSLNNSSTRSRVTLLNIQKDLNIKKNPQKEMETLEGYRSLDNCDNNIRQGFDGKRSWAGCLVNANYISGNVLVERCLYHLYEERTKVVVSNCVLRHLVELQCHVLTAYSCPAKWIV